MKRIVFASSLGTVFEYYDFLLYGSLAAFFGSLFFPPGNDTAGLLGSLATFGAGFAIRPLGAVLFGRFGDRVGRKATFLVTIVVMGLSTALVGVLPTFASIGWWAPGLLVALRLLQGLALGGEYGGAALYIAEHAPAARRGFYTSWIQTNGTMGFIASLSVVLVCRGMLGDAAFRAWGWRIPFLASIVLLGLSVYVRARLAESPLFARIRDSGQLSPSPIIESFGRRGGNQRLILVAIIVAAPMALTWYTAQFYSLVFLQGALQVDAVTGAVVMMLALLLGIPMFLGAGALSDRLGRRPVMLVGMLVFTLAVMPAYRLMFAVGSPDAARAHDHAPITVYAPPTRFAPFSADTDDATRVRDALAKRGFSYTNALPLDGGTGVAVRIGGALVRGFDEPAIRRALETAGYPGRSAVTPLQHPGDFGRDHLELVLLIATMIAGAALTGGPGAAFLVELFPTRIRYTSLSLPYHLTSAWFGGFMPLTAAWLVARTGDIFAGLWYPIAVSGTCLLLSVWLMPETRGRAL